MSKSKKNYPDPMVLVEKYSVDALRFYLMESVVMRGENLNFSEAGVKEIYQNVLSRLWNLTAFYLLYRGKAGIASQGPTPVHVMDRWLVGLTTTLVAQVTKSLDSYDTVGACRSISGFIDHCSTWYLRRSRARLREDGLAMDVFGWVLKTLVTVMAPLTPFLSERVYQNLMGTTDSVHHTDWPEEQSAISSELSAIEEKMQIVREICALGHAKRKEATVPVRQPLKECQIINAKCQIEEEYIELIKEELNVKAVKIEVGEGELNVALDTTSSPELVAEGRVRQLIRAIQQLRKEKGCTIDGHVRVEVPQEYKDLSEEHIANIKKETLTDEIVWGNLLKLLTLSTSSSS